MWRLETGHCSAEYSSSEKDSRVAPFPLGQLTGLSCPRCPQGPLCSIISVTFGTRCVTSSLGEMHVSGFQHIQSDVGEGWLCFPPWQVRACFLPQVGSFALQRSLAFLGRKGIDFRCRLTWVTSQDRGSFSWFLKWDYNLIISLPPRLWW